jgi:DNA-binding SARP family transcriptional activator/predicted ATPase
MESSPRLRIMALGPPRVLLGDTPVTFTGRKPLALLVYLAVSGRVYARDALAALLFDAATDEKARSQLRSTLTYLRAQLGEYLAVTRDTIGLAQDPSIWLDVAELEAVAQDKALRADPERLARAVSLYRGEFLAGFTIARAPEFDAWLQDERARLRAPLVRLLSRLIEHGGEQGDPATAIGWARRLLEAEPWHEVTHRQLMRLLARAGQREAALAQYDACRRVLAGKLRTVPQVETTALYEQLRAGPLAPRTSLPATQAELVGRAAELALVAERLADPACRLLTLLGLGGSGKTSLALHAAAAQARPATLPDEHPFADGVHLVELAVLTIPRTGSADPTQVATQYMATAIGHVLGLEFLGADPVAHLLDWLGDRTVLLVLDNMEHLLDGVALLSRILEAAPRLKLLVTSRERLRLREEWVLEVGGLPLPSGPDEVEQAGASSLYLQHMRQAGANEPLTESDRTAIVRICELTKGLPLALVLAARWTPSLPPATIAQDLAKGMDRLAIPGPQMLERHRSMREVLQATWMRLRENERTAMRRLAVFQSGFTREAAGAVAGVGLVALRMLGEGALIDHDPAADRYAMHEFIRQYAAEQLAGHAEEETETQARHATYYTALVQQVTPALRQTVTAQEVISADIANIRLAWDWAAERAEAGLLEQLLRGFAQWHELQGLPGQAAEALDRAAERLRTALAQSAPPDPSVQRLLGFVLVEEAMALNWQATYDRVRHLLQEARDLARVTAAPHLEGRISYSLGFLQRRQRDVRGALQWAQQALALARTAREPSQEADALVLLGLTAIDAGEYAQAKGYLDQAFEACRVRNDRYGEVDVSYARGLFAHARGQFGEAQRILEDALQRVRSEQWRLSEVFLLDALGQVHDEGWGQHVAAEGLFAQELRITQETGDRTRQGFVLAALGRNALYQGDLDRASTLLDQALSLSREVNSRASAAIALRGQSLLAHYQGDDRRAHQCAEEAIEIARTAGLRWDERLAVRLLGHALLALGELPAAQAAYQHAADLDEALGLQHLRVETATDLARVALARGNTARAAAFAGVILPDLERGALAGLEEPALAYLTGYRVLRVTGDARADAVLTACYAFLHERAAQFVDEERRSRFLDDLPAHRDLLAAWHAHGERTVPHLGVVHA